ncbi:hypothetical protein V8D89_004095 [Ganoderma adspersum]
MSLESGKYYITSADGGFPIGRRLVEDRSLNPKGIFKLPLGTESIWDVEKLANGNYSLKNRGAIVGGANGHLFAFLIEDQAATATTEWIFRADERRAREGDAYVIFEAPTGSPNGWVVPDSTDAEPYPQVVLRIIIAGPSLPPFYPPNQVFFFKKVDA